MMQPNCCCAFSTHNMRIRGPHAQCPRRSCPPFVSPTRQNKCYCQSRCDVSCAMQPTRRKCSRATGQRQSTTNFGNEGRPAREEFSRSERNRKGDEGRGDSRFMGFPRQLQVQHCIPPEFNFAKSERRQIQPLPESHCLCTYSTCSCDDDALYEDAGVDCCCEYYEQKLSDEDTQSVYDSFAQDPCCACECKGCPNNKRPTHRQKGRGEKNGAAKHSMESSSSFDATQEPPKNITNRDSATQSVQSSFQNDPTHHKGQRSFVGSGTVAPDASNFSHKGERPRSSGGSKGSPSQPPQNITSHRNAGSHGSQEQGFPEPSHQNVLTTMTRLTSNDPMFQNLFGRLVPPPTGSSHTPQIEYEGRMSRRQTLEEDYRTDGLINIGGNHVIMPDNPFQQHVNNIKPKSCMKHTCAHYRERGGSTGEHQPKAHHQGEEEEVATVDYEDLAKKESHNTQQSHNSSSGKSCKFKDLDDKEEVQEQPRPAGGGCKCVECFRKCAMACGKKDCSICCELLKMLEEHKQKQKDDGNKQVHGHDQDRGPGQESRRKPEKICSNSKCKYRKRSKTPESEPTQPPPQPVSSQPVVPSLSQPTTSESTQAATLTGSKSSSGELYFTPDQGSDPSVKAMKGTQSLIQPSIDNNYKHDKKRCINPQCHPGRTIKHVPAEKTPESRSVDVTPVVADHEKKRCINPQCHPKSTAKHTPSEKTVESKFVDGEPTVDEVSAVKEHLELKEQAFRHSPRSNNVLGPQDERMPNAYFPPGPEPCSGSATCYVLKRNPPEAYPLGVNQKPRPDADGFGSAPNCAFFSTGRYGGLPPVEEVSKEESQTTCDTLTKTSNDSGGIKAYADSKPAKNPKASTQISTNKGSTTMTFNVGVQYPSNMAVESTGKRDQGVYANVKQVASSTKQNGRTEGKKGEYKRSVLKRTIVSKSRRCLVHSYPLVNRKVSPNRAASPKILNK